MLLYLLCMLSIFPSLYASERIEKVVSVSLSNGGILLHNGLAANWIARANFTDTVFVDGWSYLEVESSSSFPDLLQSYAAGYVEGAASNTIIYNSWRNTQEGFCEWKGEKYCNDLRDFLAKNIDWMKSEIRSKRTTSPIWHHVELVLSQLKGLADGYAAVANDPITIEDLLLMNMSGDLEDLDNVFNQEKQNMTFKKWVNNKDSFTDGHCSALIKVMPNNADLYVSHVTWNTLQSMLRVQKKYIFPLRLTANAKTNQFIPGSVSTFSSYPAYIQSGDDYYLLSSGLLTQETTNGNSNPALWKNVKPEGELQEWIRVIVANRLATNGEEWCRIFEEYNSGTYNNQWMIVDYKLFKPGKPIKPKTLYILEQLPGHVKFADKTDVLVEQTYWASYNIPSFPEIFVLSGAPALVAKYGDWFSYDKSPRALIFARNHTMVQDMPSMMALMRYNDYTNDPLSKCDCTPPYSGENGISARCDLNPKNGTYPFSALGHRSHAGIDAKLTNFSLFFKMRFQAISGPTCDQLPVFKWSESDFANDTAHYGHPDAWEFSVVENKWIW